MRNALRFLGIIVLSSVLRAQAPLEIVAAYWGTGNNFADVTARVRSMVNGGSLSMPVNARSMGVDPLPGANKVLRIYYRQNGQFNQSETRENLTAEIGQRGGDRGERRPAPLRIVRAVYGAGNRAQDVTGLLQQRVVDNRLDLPVSNDTLGGDPARGEVKQLRLSYEWAGQTREIVAMENDIVRLPDGIVQGPRIRIISAGYGEGNRMMDVSRVLQRSIGDDRLAIVINNDTMGGDPARGADKTLVVVYELNGQRMEKRVREGQQLVLP